MRAVGKLFGRLGDVFQVGNEQALSHIVLAEGLVEVHLGTEAHIGGDERLQVGEHIFDLFGDCFE